MDSTSFHLGSALDGAVVGRGRRRRVLLRRRLVRLLLRRGVVLLVDRVTWRILMLADDPPTVTGPSAPWASSAADMTPGIQPSCEGQHGSLHRAPHDEEADVCGRSVKPQRVPSH